jgi:hypothetical protein
MQHGNMNVKFTGGKCMKLVLKAILFCLYFMGFACTYLLILTAV